MKRLALLFPLGLLACGSAVDATSGSASTSSSTGSSTSSSSSSSSSGSCGADVPSGEALVHVDTGAVQGKVESDVVSWKGIPYASPPTGELRWKAPAAAACWQGARDASSYGAVCPQYDATGSVTGEEDCLSLNVWAPKTATPDAKLPVMVFIHGGGHLSGSSSEILPGGQHLYDGSNFARKGAVLVTFNYRVGALGYLALPALAGEDAHKSAGNYGTLDQVAALAWVKRNIAAFGGDPSRVMIFGESAGGVAVCDMLATPLTDGLFSGALIESAGCTAKPLDTAQATGADVTKQLACDAAADVPACLRKKTVAELMTTQPKSIDISKLGNLYDAVIDGYVLPDLPGTIVSSGKHHHVPVLLGSNTDETAKAVAPITTQADFDTQVGAYLTSVGLQSHLAEVEAMYPVPGTYATFTKAMVAITSDVKFTCSARRTARALVASQKEPVYRYVFGHTAEKAGPKAKDLGAFHGFELLFVFGNMNVVVQSVTYMPGPIDLAVSSGLEDYWTSFAGTGKPSGSGLAAWAPYDATDPYIDVEDTFTAKTGYRNAECDFWHGLTGL